MNSSMFLGGISDIKSTDELRCKVTDDIKPADINRAKCQDQTFLSVLATMAEKPERIVKLFENES